MERSRILLCCKTITVLLVLSQSLLLQACREDRAETEKKVLAHDPSFRKYIDKRNTLIKELNSLQTSFLKTEQEIEEQINVLRQRKDQVKKEYVSSAEKTRRQIDPEKRRLGQDLAEMQRSYTREKSELGDIDRDIKEINDLIGKKDRLILTQEEIRAWNERLSSLVERKAAANSEVEKLKEEIKITKLKIRLLRLE